MRSRLSLIVVVAACLWTTQARLAACSCIGGIPACQATWQAHAVFVGEVLEIGDAPPADRSDSGSLYRRQVSVRVIESFRGGLEPSVKVFTGSGGGDCGYAFASQQAYLIYAHRLPNGRLTTGICSRTRPVGEAVDDLAYLRGAAQGNSKLGTIQGLARYPDPRERNASFELAPAYPGGTVTIESIDPGRTSRYQTQTGADGRYEVRVPVGKYRASLAVRDGLYSTNGFLALEILDPRGCAQADFAVHPDGRIAGRVIDTDGGAVPALSVELIDAAAVRNKYFSTGTRVRTDANGVFEFTRLAPAAYVVGLTLNRDSNATTSNAVFFELPSGTVAQQTISLDPEERTAIGDMRLPASIKLATVRGTVILEGGRPAVGARVYVLTSPSFGIAAGPIDLDSSGGFLFSLIAGRQYRLSAELLGSNSRWRKAESDPFTPAAGDSHAFTLTFKPEGGGSHNYR